MNIAKKILCCLGICAVFFLSSCSTVEGIGKDLQGLGRVIEKSSTVGSDSKSSVSPAPKDEQPASTGAIVTPVR